MKKYRPTKYNLFLLELMLNLLLFTLLITFCLQLFFKAHTLSKNTTLLHRSVTVCTSIAEVYQSSLLEDTIFLTTYPEAIALNETILIYFDSNFNACSEFESIYRAFLSPTEDNNKLNIRFLRKNETDIIYELTVSSYTPLSLGTLMGGTHP